MLILCDGGCDVLLTGAESGLATPVEDMSHLKAEYYYYRPLTLNPITIREL